MSARDPFPQLPKPEGGVFAFTERRDPAEQAALEHALEARWLRCTSCHHVADCLDPEETPFST